MTPVLTRSALMMAVVVTALLPDVGFGQTASPAETQLQMERRQKRAIVRPAPPDETVERDAQAATTAVEQHQRQAETLRELWRPSSRRPDLDYDVKSGIQSQRLHDAVRR
jgi:hypothetical protein